MTSAAQSVRCVGIVGAGTMGAGIATSCATAGLAVTLVDATAEALTAGLARVAAQVDSAVRKGRLTHEEAADARGRVRGTASLQDLAAADLVIEAAFENLAVKQRIFGELGATCRAGTVLATNTSTLDVDAIASASGRASDVVGMHFFSPAHVMKLVEIVRGRASSAGAIATARAVAGQLGKLAVVVGNCFGFVGNRMLYAYGREKEFMLLEGATPEQVDRALEAFGMAMGPSAVGDLAGLDVGCNVRREWRDRPDDPRYYRASDLLAGLGRYGQKTGRGFYRYDGPAATRVADPEVVELLRAEAARLGVAARTVSDAEIVARCMAALVNEGARVLGEGIAASPADVDTIWCNGYGFPRARGGPLRYADARGLAGVLEDVERFGRELGARYWAPAPLLVELAQLPGGFYDWQARRGEP
jgi:3-hydroxyacyl-CoA dehydrogenase